jgi:hypothetical protein
MQLAIAQNPYTKNPQELWSILRSQELIEDSADFDPAGLDTLKQKLRANPRFVVK